MGRISFFSAAIRNIFFESARASLGFTSWQGLALNLQIRRTQLDDYRSGKLSLPDVLYHKLILKMGTRKISYFSSRLKILEDNWGRAKGGRVTYAKHSGFFEEGRRRAIQKRLEGISVFDINLPLSTNLAYFVGLFIGDGFCNKYGRHHLTQFVGHKTEELEYYKSVITSISKELFDLSPTIRFYPPANYIRVNYYSRSLFLCLTKRFKIKSGKKSYDVLIPGEIMNASKEILLSCIAGIYDAEACVFFDRRRNYSKPYPRIDLHMINPSILKQIGEVLHKTEIPHSFTNNHTHLLVYGKDAFHKFLTKVHLKNPKHLKKIELYKLEVG